MRASAGITWHLLLSLSFLFQIVLSDSVDPTPSNSTVTDSVASTKATKLTDGTTGTTTTVKSVDKDTKMTAANAPTIVTTTAAVTTVSTPKPTDKPVTIATQPTTTAAITNRTTPAPTNRVTDSSTVVTNATTPAATTTAPVQTTVTATAAPKNDGNNGSVTAPTVNTSVSPSSTTSIPGGGVMGGNTATAGPIHTNTPLQGQTPTAQTTTASKTTQDSGKGVDVASKATTMPQSLEGTSSKTTPIPGLTVSTTNPTDVLDTRNKATRPQSTATTTAASATTSAGTAKSFTFSLNKGDGHSAEDKEMVEVCKRLMVNMENGDCKMKYHHLNEKVVFDSVEISGNMKPALVNQYYEDVTKKPTDNKTLIAILASCGALLIMIVILAVCASHHRRPYHENQQHLTEELHTVENGYHDNPTLEVMEVQPEMQEKKMALNGEFNDGWIVPMDNLPKGEIPEEEDTHL